MKTILAILAIAFQCFLVEAAAYDDVLYLINHKGPDFYSDGSKVIDGEMYAVVFQRNGTEFAGFDLMGQLANTNDSQLVAALPFAKNSRCIPFILQLSKDYVASLGEGTFDVYLLDSRQSFSNGKYILSNANTTNMLRFARSYAKVGAVSGGTLSRSTDVLNTTYARVDGVEPIDMAMHVSEVTNVVEVAMTNTIEVVKTNVVTEVVEIAMTNYIDKVVERTVIRYIDIERQPPMPEPELKTIPSVDSGKMSTYSGVVYGQNHIAVGTATVKMYAPNSYGIVHGSATLKIDVPGKNTKKTYTKAFYGMVDDLGGASGYFKKYAGKISFKLKLGEGFVEVYDTKTKSNIEYEIECEFVK